MIELLQTSPPLMALCAGIIGLLVGSFLNVVIHRLPKMMEAEWHQQCAELRGEEVAAGPAYNLVVPRSACPGCGHRIGALENIPVLSWLALRGRCRGCGARISPRYPLVEGLCGLLSAWLALRLGPGWALGGALLFSWALIAAAFIDLDTTLLPDDITLPLLWLGLLLNLRATFVPLEDAVIGAAAGYLSLWSVYWLFKLATGKEGMGFGDFKLLAAIGAFLGWNATLFTLVAACNLGLLATLPTLLVRRKTEQIPFGPYLAAGALLWMADGPGLWSRYLLWLSTLSPLPS